MSNSISNLASQIIKAHDKNGNGTIERKHQNGSGNWLTDIKQDELVVKVDQRNLEYSRREAFFRSADSGRDQLILSKADGVVTQEELEAKLKTFDKNGNGELDESAGLFGFLPWVKSEAERFKAEYDRLMTWL